MNFVYQETRDQRTEELRVQKAFYIISGLASFNTIFHLLLHVLILSKIKINVKKKSI